MKTPRRLSLSLTWEDGTGAVSHIDWRPLAVVLLCGACYLFGRWQATVENEPLSRAQGTVMATPLDLPALPASVLSSSAEDQERQIITPLNVRDPSALVMGPAPSQSPPAAAPPPVPSRLLRELEKDD